MSLQTKIEEKLNQSLKNKDKNLYPTLRLVVSAIKDAIIASRTKENKGLAWKNVVQAHSAAAKMQQFLEK